MKIKLKQHINYVSNKLRTVSFLMYSSILYIHISLFCLHIGYCELLGNIYTTNIQCFYLLQNIDVWNIAHTE